MRVPLAVLSAASLFPSCFEPRPCFLVSPNLTVIIAESLESREPSDSLQPPIRARLHTHLLGPSPGLQFRLLHNPTQPVRPGDLFYIESFLTTNEPIDISRACAGSVSGPYSEQTHASRIQFFRDLAAGKMRDASLVVSTHAPGAEVIIQGPSGMLRRQADQQGTAEWKSLPPGNYAVSAAKVDFTPARPAEPFQLAAGACHYKTFVLHSRYRLRGTLRTAAGGPARHAELFLQRDDQPRLPLLTNA